MQIKRRYRMGLTVCYKITIVTIRWPVTIGIKYKSTDCEKFYSF